jgi:WLM domain
MMCYVLFGTSVDVQVGVSDVCVMGLNENHGQTIRLRLRTDDLQGFRKPLSIKKV